MYSFSFLMFTYQVFHFPTLLLFKVLTVSSYCLEQHYKLIERHLRSLHRTERNKEAKRNILESLLNGW